jgi:hypothetical protein
VVKRGTKRVGFKKCRNMKHFPRTVLIRKFSVNFMQVARCSPVASGTTEFRYPDKQLNLNFLKEIFDLKSTFNLSECAK